MAISGTWKASMVRESGAQKWGTGWNPVHAVYGAGPPVRQSPAHTGQGGDLGDEDVIEPQLLEHEHENLDFNNQFWALETEFVPSYDVPPEQTRGHMALGYPSPDEDGESFRSEHPLATSTVAKASYQQETVTEGWENKDAGFVDNSTVSDISQYEMQTSMSQRDKTREGSQISGTASEYSAPVPSARPTWGQRLKPWSGGQRHYDMEPYQQEDFIRPFLFRNAGTGDPQWMQANDMYVSQPHERVPAPDPAVGTPEVSDVNDFTDETSWILS